MVRMYDDEVTVWLDMYNDRFYSTLSNPETPIRVLFFHDRWLYFRMSGDTLIGNIPNYPPELWLIERLSDSAMYMYYMSAAPADGSIVFSYMFNLK